MLGYLISPVVGCCCIVDLVGTASLHMLGAFGLFIHFAYISTPSRMDVSITAPQIANTVVTMNVPFSYGLFHSTTYILSLVLSM